MGPSGGSVLQSYRLQPADHLLLARRDVLGAGVLWQKKALCLSHSGLSDWVVEGRGPLSGGGALGFLHEMVRELPWPPCIEASIAPALPDQAPELHP